MAFAAICLALLVALGAVVAIREADRDRVPGFKAADAIGTWEGSKGGRIDIKEDGKVTLAGVRTPPACLRDATPESVFSGEGAWALDQRQDEPPGVRFDYEPENSGAPMFTRSAAAG
ncbi:hypothetical protein ACFWBF_33055 [Streptomyces sp. NPDC060028]|uniref:hypothetical protein n=1 Tax=Streptomyces sp. NPDC060028 TaxID=3347041 RepID=UPI0036AA10AD